MTEGYSTWLEIDLDHIRGNVRLLLAAAGTPVMAVVKADGYGHGALAVARSNRGLLRLNAGQADEAESDLQEARRLLKKLTDEFPTRPDFRLRLAEANRRLGILSQKASRLDQAKESIQLALADQRELVKRFADVPEYRSTLGATLNEGSPCLPRQTFAGVTGSTGFIGQEGALHDCGAAGTEIAPLSLQKRSKRLRQSK